MTKNPEQGGARGTGSARPRALRWDVPAQVDGWFAGKPAEPTLRRVREVIMNADSRMTESLKYGTVVFASGGDFCSFVQHNDKRVNVMFNRGAKIVGKFPHLEGSGPTARFMRFADVAEVNARAAELTKITIAWCDLMQAPKAKSTVKKKA